MSTLPSLFLKVGSYRSLPDDSVKDLCQILRTFEGLLLNGIKRLRFLAAFLDADRQQGKEAQDDEDDQEEDR